VKIENKKSVASQSQIGLIYVAPILGDKGKKIVLLIVSFAEELEILNQSVIAR